MILKEYKQVQYFERKKNHIKLLFWLFFTLLFFYAFTIYAFRDNFLPEVKITRDAYYLRFRLEQIVKMPQYQKYCGVTFCNMLARDTLDDRFPWALGKGYPYYIDDFHYDLTAVFPTERHIYMSIVEAYDRAKLAAEKGLIFPLTMKQAQTAANAGILVWGVSKKYNHEFLICPDWYRWESEKGCLIAQAGEVNGIFYISDYNAFGRRYRDREIKFYTFPRRNQ